MIAVFMETELDRGCRAILAYLGAASESDARGEVSALELEKVLGLSPETVRGCLENLLSLGAVQADLFPLNVWASITAEGPEVLARMTARAGQAGS
jgi:hypothetical protein